MYTDRKNVTNFLYLVLHLACKVTCYFRLFSSVLVSVLRTSINVLSKSKSRNYVTWIANLTKLFLSVWPKTSPNLIFCFIKKNGSLRDFYIMTLVTTACCCCCLLSVSYPKPICVNFQTSLTGK